MKFGLFGGGKIGKTNPLDDSYGYRDFIQYVKDAEELGFKSVFLVEHHFTGAGQLSASLNLLSYIAASTTRIRLGTAVVVLPWHNPVLLAEQISTLDVLSGGRVDLGVGRGYRRVEFDSFCIPMSEAQDRYTECLELLLKSFASKQRFSHHGKYWHFDNIVVEPAPVQLPHPPVWMAAGRPEGIAYVGRSNYNLLLDQIGNVEETVERVRIYCDAQEAAGLPRDASRVGVTRSLNIVYNETQRQAAYTRRRETLKKIGELARKPEGYSPESFADADIAADDAALIGTPEEIVEQLKRLQAGGIEYVLLTNATADRASLETFAEKIMPYLTAGKAPALRSALGRFPTGVTIVAAVGSDNLVHCMTVNSFTSLSLDPPLVMWALRTNSARHATLTRCDIFSVNVLSESQIELARQHAMPQPTLCAVDSWDTFLDGCPIIEGAAAHFVCRSAGQMSQGDHTVLVGEICRFVEGDSKPLLFMSGGFYSSAQMKPL
jgi:alkanesulfonate monooxygenase SsuD/methylene tetrahydromethanopterin reductase-like flavin-dependent oxidoreductase (luciferase family)/flavin reductase (DIM6/NTAB) family NADH-FMN oxidoreductase RutF